jgi:hypothetical protein
MPRKLDKIIREMPKNARKVLLKLADDLRDMGPVQPAYPNYSKLGELTYHCHLAYSWVACWRCDPEKTIVEQKDDTTGGRVELVEKILLEVEYVGSREKAPY